MFFKEETVYQVYKTQKGAERYIAKYNLTQCRIETIGDHFFVVA